MIHRLLNSVFARVVFGYVLVAVILGGAWLYSLSGPLTTVVVDQQERNLIAVARSAALLVGQSGGDPQRVADQLVKSTDLRLTIVASDGTVLADSDYAPAKMENHGGRPEVRAALAGRTGVARRVSATEGNEQIYVAVPGFLDGRRVAVRVAQPLTRVESAAARLRRFGVLLLAVAAAVASFAGWRATRSVARPIERLSEASLQMAAGDLGTPIPEVPTDLKGLADSLAALRDQVNSRLAALETERQTVRTALDGLRDAVLLLEDGAIVLANRSAIDLLFSGSRFIEGTPLAESALPAPLRAEIERQLDDATASGTEMEPDPTGRAWRVTTSRLSAPGARRRYVAVISDITERSRLERVRREFVANASHELKTPVAGIRLLAESAEMASADGDRESSETFTRQIAAEVARLQDLVTDLLNLSRLEGVPAPGSIADVRAAVDNAFVGHGLEAERRGVGLRVDWSDVSDEHVFVASDPTDLAVALDNMLANAIKYTDEGSVTVSVTADAAEVRISVSDTGRGIPAEHLERIFERFYRVDQGRDRDSGGTGLGLSLVRHMAERNGGSISVTSEEGEGSTFVLTLPRRT